MPGTLATGAARRHTRLWTPGPGGLRGWDDRGVGERFLQLSEVAEILDVSASQAYALVRSGRLRAIKIGGRGQWRVERAALEEFIRRCYTETEQFVAAHPFGSDLDDDAPQLPPLSPAQAGEHRG